MLLVFGVERLEMKAHILTTVRHFENATRFWYGASRNEGTQCDDSTTLLENATRFWCGASRDGAHILTTVQHFENAICF